VPIANYNLHWLRQSIGLVAQEPKLFDTTIRENILFGKLGKEEKHHLELFVVVLT